MYQAVTHKYPLTLGGGGGGVDEQLEFISCSRTFALLQSTKSYEVHSSTALDITVIEFHVGSWN